MNIQEAICKYNNATGSREIERTLSPEATQAVSDILSVATLCENSGGKLTSQQAVAVIIHFSKAKLEIPTP